MFKMKENEKKPWKKSWWNRNNLQQQQPKKKELKVIISWTGEKNRWTQWECEQRTRKKIFFKELVRAKECNNWNEKYN